MSVKILVISNYNDPVVTRPEAEIFIALHKEGFEVEIITPGDSEYAKRFKDEGIKVYDKLISKKYNKSEIDFIKNIIKEGKHDILQLFNGAAIVNGMRAAKGIKISVVLYRGFSGHINWWDPAAYTKFLNPRADKIICNSIGVEEIFHRQLFFDKKKAITINKGHDLKWYEQISPFSREELKISQKSLAIVCVANNRPMKGVKYLMKAITLLPSEMNFDLFLIGKGLDNDEFRLIIKDHPNEKKVHFMGFRKDALRIVAACDVFALASLKGESITKAALEAMSLGLAPIISDIAGNRELVDSGDNGIVFPVKNSFELANGLIEMEKNREQTKLFGIHSRERMANKLNIKTTVKKYGELYKSLAEKKD